MFTFAKLQVDKILKIIPKERKTYLYSATMTKKVTHVFRIQYCGTKPLC